MSQSITLQQSMSSSNKSRSEKDRANASRTERVKRAPTVLPTTEFMSKSIASHSVSAAPKSTATFVSSASQSRASRRSRQAPSAKRRNESESSATAVSKSAQRLVASLYDESIAASHKIFRSAAAAAPSSLTASHDERVASIAADNNDAIVESIESGLTEEKAGQSEQQEQIDESEQQEQIDESEQQEKVQDEESEQNEYVEDANHEENLASSEMHKSAQDQAISMSASHKNRSRSDFSCSKPTETSKVEQSVEKSVKKLDQQSVEQSAEQSVEQSAEQSVEQNVEQSVEQSAQKNAEQSVESSKSTHYSVDIEPLVLRGSERWADSNDANAVQPPPPMPSNWSRHKQTKWHFSKTPFAYIENDDLEDPLLFSVNQAHNKAADVAELRPLQIIGVQERHVLYDDDNNPVEETWIGLKAKHAPNGSASTLVVDSDGCFGARDTSENIFVPGQIHFVESLDRLRVNVKRSGCATRIQWLK